MVQLEMLGCGSTRSLTEVLREATDEARRMGVSDTTVSVATRATGQRFADEYDGRCLDRRDGDRVKGYFRAVARRQALRGGGRSNVRYRDVLRVRSALADLRGVGLSGGLLRTELVETLGLPSDIVDYVLDTPVGVA